MAGVEGRESAQRPGLESEREDSLLAHRLIKTTIKK
jgi:hypothetical protein